MRRRPLGRQFAGTMLALLGVVVVVIELIRRWIGVDPTGPHVWPVSIGFVFFVYGSYLLWPKQTKATVTFIVDQGTRVVRVVRVVRTGRRSGDKVAITDGGEMLTPVVPAITTVLPTTHPGVEDVDLPPPSAKGGR